MTTIKEHCLELMAEHVKTRSNKRKEEIAQELDHIFNTSPQDWCAAYDESLHQARSMVESEYVKQQLTPILKIVSAKYIAETYFNRSSAWFSQRVNHNKVANSIVTFKPEELQQIEDAIHDIGRKLLEFHIKSK